MGNPYGHDDEAEIGVVSHLEYEAAGLPVGHGGGDWSAAREPTDTRFVAAPE